MPRPEDIAWKFVVRLEGKRWRCPYCHKGSSGSVTRVKSHFLKQPKEGIAYCTKVPEHIRTLMELLLNHEVHKKEDIAWKFVDRVEDNKWRCHYCSVEFSGDLRGVKGHLLKVRNEGISICTEVPDHVGTLMRSLLDEVAEEGSRGANGQSSLEPQSHGMPAQAEAAEDESGEANGEFSTVPQSCDILTQVEVAEEESRDANSQSSIEPQGSQLPPDFFSQDLFDQWEQLITVPDIGVDSEQQSQAECQFLHQSINHETRDMQQNATMPLDNRDTAGAMQSQVQNSHGESISCSTMALVEAEAPRDLRDQSQCNIRSQMQMNVQQTPAGPSSCQYDQSTAAVRPVRQPQSVPHQSINHETRNAQQYPTMSLDVSHEEITSSVQHLSTDRLALSSLNPSKPQVSLDQVFDNSMSNGLQEFIADGITPCSSSPGWSTLFNSLPKSRDVNVNTSEEIQMNEVHNPTVGSSLRNDSFLDVDRTNRLQDSQPCEVEVVPVPGIVSNTSPTNTVQHPNQLHPRYDKEDGNDTCLFPSLTPMDIEPSIASRHSTDSHIIEATTIDSQVPEVATNTPGPLSSQDVNRGSPIMDVRSIYANNEEIRKLKRKVEELNNKEAVIKKQMEIESGTSSVRKKPRILVERWLKETERARNNFQIIGQANVETLPPKEQVETLTRETEELIKQTLPQTLLIEERDAKEDTFLERELTGQAIHRNIELIWGCLKKNHARKLGIYGMGGVGKTTIMMHIHNRLLEDATFNGVAFITVSQDFSIYKLQSDIWEALQFGFMKDEHEKKRAAKLSKRLERKKNCVLILDDVWERLDLEEVGIPVRADGFKLVLTTRSFDVCCQMQCQEKIKIDPLSQKEAESLFFEELGSKAALNLEIEAVAKSIVRECAGLPIGVITMARSMRGVTDAFEWRDSLVKLKESSKGQTDMEKKVLMNLKFSYDRLGDPDVQQCFLSCALYPEDEFNDRFKLVEFFIDQGLIDGLNSRREQYDRGLTILNKLINVCLLEDHRSRFKILGLKMHDLIRDMALHIMGATSIVKAGKFLRKIPLEEYWTDVLEKVSLMQNFSLEFPLNMSPNCPKLSVLLLNECGSWNVPIPDSFFKNLLGLKVLNLSGNGITELPNSISDLVNLRALLLGKCRKLCRIPYLGKLTSLRKLDATGCESLEVLEGLEKLVNLRYLDLTETPIKRLPKGMLDHLLNLQCLKVSVVIEEDITKFGALETFECYSRNADDFSKCVRLIEQSNNPCYYNLCVNPFPNRNMSLKIQKFIVKVSDDAQFGILGRSVNIRKWDHAILSVGGECTGIYILIPRDVHKMTMIKCNGITNLSSIDPLEYLEKLKIEGCDNLGVLCGGQDEEGIDIHDSPAPTPTPLLFPNLRVLKIFGCLKLKYLFEHGSKSNLPHLQKIEIRECKKIVGIIAAVTSPPPHPLPFFPSLEVIWIDRCGKMKRAVESEWMPHFPNLTNLILRNCGKLEEIIRGPPPYVPVEEISLAYLEVEHCDNMRKLFPHEWLLHLQNLESIYVLFCKGMVEMISGVRQGQEGSIMTPVNNTPSSFQPPITLPKLECLVLCNLPQLKSICEVPISCDSMNYLVVRDCPELKGIPLQLRLREIEELPYILVEDEEMWKTLKWDNPKAQAILQPYLRKGKRAIDRRNISVISPWDRSSPNAIELSVKGKDLL